MPSTPQSTTTSPLGTAKFPPGQNEHGSAAAGIVFGALAYASWGFLAFYFKAVEAADPLEITCHRVIWAVLLLAGMVHIRRQWGTVWELLRLKSTWRSVSVSTVLIAINWLVFVYAVVSDRLVEASLGYFINPLVSIILGMIFLGERLRVLQWAAFGFVVLGVAVYTYGVGTLPWISITVALCFGLYGLVRKRAGAGPIVGLFIETSLLLPLALGYLVFMKITGIRPVIFGSRGAAGGSLGFDMLLMLAGLMTALPLLWFTAATRRLRLSTIGFMQYMTPSIQFLLAVLVFDEPFGRARAIAFAIIWTGVTVFIIDSAKHTIRNRPKRPAAQPHPARND